MTLRVSGKNTLAFQSFIALSILAWLLLVHLHPYEWKLSASKKECVMSEAIELNKDFFFNIVADNLLRSFGSDAFHYADEALKKMHSIGDEEGFDLWLSIHSHLSAKAGDKMVTQSKSTDSPSLH